MGIRVVQQISN